MNVKFDNRSYDAISESDFLWDEVEFNDEEQFRDLIDFHLIYYPSNYRC